MQGWAIPQDNRMVHQILSDKTNEKLLCLNVHVDKLTCEHYNKKPFFNLYRCKQKKSKILQNRKCWPQVQIRSTSQGHISLPVHYFFCLFNKHVKTLQERLK